MRNILKKDQQDMKEVRFKDDLEDLRVILLVLGGNAAEFIEKRDYKPKIELIYVDERGRNQTPKEAFRKLSHRFHGKGSGKMKQEKRMKKFAEEDAMKYMNSTDTPLNTVAMMKQKQKSQSTPYIVLSGGGKTFISGNSTNSDISKK